MVVSPPVPRPPSTRQALKPYVVTSSTQVKAESCSPDDLFPLLTEANTRTGVPLKKLLLNDTFSQWLRPIPICWMSIFPFSTTSKEKKTKKQTSDVFMAWKRYPKLFKIVSFPAVVSSKSFLLKSCPWKQGSIYWKRVTQQRTWVGMSSVVLPEKGACSASFNTRKNTRFAIAYGISDRLQHQDPISDIHNFFPS